MPFHIHFSDFTLLHKHKQFSTKGILNWEVGIQSWYHRKGFSGKRKKNEVSHWSWSLKIKHCLQADVVSNTVASSGLVSDALAKFSVDMAASRVRGAEGLQLGSLTDTWKKPEDWNKFKDFLKTLQPEGVDGKGQRLGCERYIKSRLNSSCSMFISAANVTRCLQCCKRYKIRWHLILHASLDHIESLKYI